MGTAVVLAQSSMSTGALWLTVFGGIAFVFLFVRLFSISRYKRCPPNQLMVVFGLVGQGRACKVLHGGATFVTPLIQQYLFISLEPYSLEVNLGNEPTADGTSIRLRSTVHCEVTTDPAGSMRAAERLIGLDRGHIQAMTQDLLSNAIADRIAALPDEDVFGSQTRLKDCLLTDAAAVLGSLGIEIVQMRVLSVERIER